MISPSIYPRFDASKGKRESTSEWTAWIRSLNSACFRNAISSRFILWLLAVDCFLSIAPIASAGDILRGNSSGSSSSGGNSAFYGGNQAAMSQLQNNANDILTRVAQATRSVQAMQQAARNAALQATSNVPNGLTPGGLQIATGTNAFWQGANLPVQSMANGQTTVTIQQTSPQAILNWQTFNLGRNTTAYFNQSAGGNAANTWVALNRILDPLGVPSIILGSIKAQGQVYLINQNGIIFGGASQVNVSSLVAAAASITNSQFSSNGIYTPVSQGTLGNPSFTGGFGAVIVEAGAQISTNAPLQIQNRGGAVILLGGSVENDGSITTAGGQTLLAAGRDFFLVPGYSVASVSSSTSNPAATTLGTEVAVTQGGTALNTGLIQATTGDITMVGHEVTQAGIMISSSSVDQRGTIHLLTSTTDSSSSVTLAAGSVTYIEPDPDSGTALDPQRTSAYQAGIAYLNQSSLNDQAGLPDRSGISRIEITTGGTVDFAGNSLTSATAGQIAVSAGQRIFVASKAELDVSGLVGVSLPMSANNLAVNIQGFELRDDALNRDTEVLFNSTVYVDLRQLVEVPANSSYNAPYNTENRYYTAGGLLEVSGELNNVGHSIQEWDTVGGGITLSSNQVVAQAGSVFNVAGGSIQYQGGYLKQSYVVGSDGRIYNVNTAPGGIQYLGVFQGFVVNHPRWNVSETYQNVISQPGQIYVPGYTEGRDAGSLTIDAPTTLFAGTIEAQTSTGPEQNTGRPSTVSDPFLLTESTVPLNGTLVIGPYSVVVNGETQTGTLYSSNVVIGNTSSVTAGLTATAPLSKDLENTNTLSAAQISNADLGGLTVDVQAAPKPTPSTSQTSSDTGQGILTISSPLNFAEGAQISLTAAQAFIAGGIFAPSGNVSINTLSYDISGPPSLAPAKPVAGITLESNGTIDTAGLWTNAFLNPADIIGEAYNNGGNITLSSNQGITLAAGSLIDASSGAAVLPNGKTVSGTGGNVSIEADQVGNVALSPNNPRKLLTISQAISRGPLILDGILRSYGVKAGGTLTLQAYSVIIGDGITAAAPDQLVLPSSFFNQGFSNYTIHGMSSVTVEPGTTVNVTEPVYQFNPNSFKVATGASLATALGAPLLMPVYIGNPDTGAVIQRPGASLSLLAGVDGQTPNPPIVAAGGSIDIGTGSTINVDPGQSINLEGAAQITVNGTLHAPSGSIEIVNYRPLGGTGGTGKNLSFEPGSLSIWIGANARLDVAAQAFVASDQFGRPYGVVPNGGSIVLGSTGGVDPNEDLYSTDAFVIIRPGAILNASGTSAVLDLFAGANPPESFGGTPGASIVTDRVLAASNGGLISLSSYDGIYIDGTLRAAAGGPGGAGGTLALSFIGPDYSYQPPPFSNLTNLSENEVVPGNLRVPRTIIIEQGLVTSSLPATLQAGQTNPNLKVGYAVISASTINEGGFDNLSLYAANSILFRGDVSLKTGESIKFFDTSLADTKRNGQVTISAPYVFFGGTTGSFQITPVLGTSGTSNPLTNNPGTVQGTAVLNIEADLIDLQYTNFGDFETSSPTAYLGNTINYPAFADVNFVSQGDIRLLSGGTIKTPGNFTFTAAQLYPISGASATVEAGFIFSSSGTEPFAAGTSISIYRINSIDPAVPQSVFGQLTLEAQTINQGGIVRAPLGGITFGISGVSTADVTENVNFLSGSITSVSANGLIIPYGGTTDGVTYIVNGQPINSSSVIGGTFSQNRGITLEGYSVSVAKGALLDLSGGGTLFGEGFISGRGGSLDVLTTALVNQNPSNTFSASNNTVYALVPGIQGYAPSVVDTNTGDAGNMPGIGEQITVPAGVPGLPAGTYTLMPSNYALLPGAFRVELGGRGDTIQPSVLSLENGSYEVNVNLGIANAGVKNALPVEAIFTAASVVETYSEYDLETYSAVAISQAQRFNQARPLLPADASTLTLQLIAPPTAISQLQFAGTADFAAAPGGYSGSLVISGEGNAGLPAQQIEITGPNSIPTAGWISLNALAIDAIGAPSLYIGGNLRSPSIGSFLVEFNGNAAAVTIRTGAFVTGDDVTLISQGSGGLTIESGATIDTLGQGAPAFDSTSGYFFTNSTTLFNGGPEASVVAVSNGYINVLPGTGAANGPITVANGASLFSDGTIAFATNGGLNLGEDVNYGARYIGFSAAYINIGTPAGFAAAEKEGSLPTGLLLDQTVLGRLLAGDPALGAPALQILTLSAADSINFFGSVDLNTINPTTGKSSLQEMVFDTPAVYGSGSGSDVATITTGTLVWNGLAQLVSAPGIGGATTYLDTPPGPVITGGPGTGQGTLNIVANEIVFGYSPMDQPQNLASLGRLVLGFSAVNLTASQEITANSKGSFSVYLAETSPGNYSGGNLNLVTPLLTGAPGSVVDYKTGGVLTLIAPAGIAPTTTMSDSLGAEIDLSANTISISTSIEAASGKVTLTASGNLSLNDGSRIDVSGLTVAMFDQNVSTFGGYISLESTAGNITQTGSSVIDVSAVGNNAGSLTVTATGASGGQVTLGGSLEGSSTGEFNAGSFDIRAQNAGDFSALNQLLDAGGFFYARSFDIKQGNVTVDAGTTITAHTVEISVDNGSLTISGTINASGSTPGTIRLSAGDNLELTSTAVLDVHNSVLQVDSYGQPIDAENRGTIELTVADGTDTSTTNLNNGQGSLLLDAGATINMASPDDVARGDLELNVPRTGEISGDIRISAAGPLNINGAQTIALNAFWTYAPTDPNGTIVQNNGDTNPVATSGPDTGFAGIYQIDQQNGLFINAALANGDLQSRLTGLKAYGASFHLRPGVEIVSDTPNGNLTVAGDIDLSGYRYGPNADVNPSSPGYGSGEPGVLILRAGGNLNIYGSISDGFAPVSLPAGAVNPDENGWVLFAGQTTAYNVVINTTGVTLAAGTRFSNNAVTLSYAIPIGHATLNPDVTIPLTVTLSSAYTVKAAFVTTATITIPGGGVFHAGQTVPANTTLQKGTTFGAGSVLPFSIPIDPVTWPAGASLADFSKQISLAANVQLGPGDLIPGGSTLAFAGGVKSVVTRPVVNGIQGEIYAVEPMLPQGALSWSIRLVAGADTSAADTRILQAQTALDGSGNLVLDDPHISLESRTPIFSVIRTGTGYLDLLAGGSFTEDSLYGVYTAGTQTPNITDVTGGSFDQPRSVLGDQTVLGGKYIKNAYAAYETIAGDDYQAYYPNGGGNVFVSAQGNITGFSVNELSGPYIGTYFVSDWLWTQGGSGLKQNAAWWINFGTYVPGPSGPPVVTGFTGIGALGGGNVIVQSGGNAGVMSFSYDGASSGSLVVAVAGTGRVVSSNSAGGGSLVETGGGDVTISVGGGLNPAASSYQNNVETGFAGGTFVDLRGKLDITAGSIGGIDLVYGESSPNDPRPTTVSMATVYSYAFGGPDFVVGDATATLQVRGDLVIGSADDPGINSSPVNDTEASLASNSAEAGAAASWFTLWTSNTEIDALSAGGNVTPNPPSRFSSGLYPGILRIFATSGSIYAGDANPGALELAPSPTGQLEMLAEGSIYAGAFQPGNLITSPLIFEISGASTGPGSLPTPFDPAWELLKPGTQFSLSPRVLPGGTNTLSNSSTPATLGLFAFEFDNASGTLHANDPSAAMIYAVTGDIVDLEVGQVQTLLFGNQSLTNYVAAKAMEIRAGGDIVNFGQYQAGTNSPSLILNNSSADVSVLSAGNEILFANVDIAGPGTLEISAGGNIYQGAQGKIESVGLLGTPKLINPDGGASIVVLAGVGTNGPDWTAFADLYLNPANLASPNSLLVDQPGKVIATYQDKLVAWLQQQYRYKGSASDALTYFQSLPIDQQSVFLLQVYFTELNQSGLQYNAPTSAFFHSYLRGQEAIAALFPTTGADGQKITYSGSLTMFSAENATNHGVTDSSILTDFGGSITTVVPGGQTIVGVSGVTPGAHAGILTQGSGDIDMYSEGSVLLGESRVLTTFGGGIVIWSATGDINAGVGAKGTIIFAPPGIVYDNYSDIVLAPTVPSSGAGIGTLAPIPDVPAGDVNLIAPLGTIDAGEAGIRASGNANLAARVIINAANISVAGKTTGIPTVVTPNVAAITAASNAVGSSNSVAQEVAKQEAAQSQEPLGSVIIVEVLGYGGGDDSSASPSPTPVR